MANFTGDYIVYVDGSGAFPLPPAWWLAARAGDPEGDPGPNLIVVPLSPETGEVLFTTLDRHILMVQKIRALPEDRPERAALEVFAFDKCGAVGVTQEGDVPALRMVEDITGHLPGDAVRLRGTGTGFRLSKA